MRILVTGGAGFIASHIVDAYINEGHSVAIVDNLSSGLKEFINPKASFFELDIQAKELDRVFDEFKPEIVNHHAAHIDLRRSVVDPAHDASTNIFGMLNLISCMRNHRTKKIIFASTGGAIYGEPAELPVPESHSAQPLSPYGVNKLAAEHYIRIYSAQDGFDYTVLRYANVYGPRQNPKGEAGVVAIFCLKLLSSQQPVIFGDGSKTRDYVFVSDVVRANCLAIEKASHEILNIGCGIEISDSKVFDAVSKALHHTGSPAFDRVRPGEVLRIALSPKEALRKLTWQPEIVFNKGVSIAAEFYERNRLLFR